MSKHVSALLRPATESDIPSLHALIEQSVRVLQAGDYTPEQIDGALGTVLGLDTQLVLDRTYFVAEVDSELSGCGGWSKRKTLFGSDGRVGREDSLLDPMHDAAKIRAFFIHPKWTRRGIATQILTACEADATEAGFTRFEMGATLTGVPLYLACGYQIVEQVDVPLPNGLTLQVIRMWKTDETRLDRDRLVPRSSW